MKRKKWTEEEERTLIGEYSDLLSSGALSKLWTRAKKFQPIADRVNSIHNLCNPSAFPFRWSWRDVSIKIQNMRHQYLNVKQKILGHPSPSSSAAFPTADFDWDHGVHLWPNFLRYKQVFGDFDLDLSRDQANNRNASDSPLEIDLDSDEGEEEEEEEEAGEELAGDRQLGGSGEEIDEAEDLKGLTNGCGNCEELRSGSVLGQHRGRAIVRTSGKLRLAAERVVELGEIGMRREEKRRERESAKEEEEYARVQKRRAREIQREMDWRLVEENRDRWRRRREERREQEEMEWTERVIGMQMEYEKQVMQMHADACQAQMHMLGILIRLMCQFLEPTTGVTDAVLGGLPPQHVMQNVQQQAQHQQSPENLEGDDGKNDAHSGGRYL